MSTKSTSYNFPIARAWHLLDAGEDSFGRIATRASHLLQGKHKPSFSSQADCGDFVVVANIKNLRVSRNTKWKGKEYFRYSGYPGGLRKRTLLEMYEKDPKEIMRLAVFSMLPKNKLRARRMRRLKLFLSEKEGKELVAAMRKKKKGTTKSEKQENGQPEK